jgi:VRR-NUC domain
MVGPVGPPPRGGVAVSRASSSEAAFTAAVLQLMKITGWKTLHIRPARTASGDWRTPVSGDGVGFPDLIAVKGDRIIAAELKTTKGRLGPGQREWLAALAAAGVEVFIWTPADWDVIAAQLRGQLELGGAA